MDNKDLKNTENIIDQTFNKITNNTEKLLNEKNNKMLEKKNIDVVMEELHAAKAATGLWLENQKEEVVDEEVETEAEEEFDEAFRDFRELKRILKANNYYSHLSCGKYLQGNLDINNLKIFLNEFMAYGIASMDDKKLIDIIKKL